jgi:hypothetical protein
MPADSEYQPRYGTALATFAHGGTYSDWVQLNGQLVALYSETFPIVAAGSLTFRSSWGASGTGQPVQTNDGTVLRVLAWGTEGYYTFGEDRFNTRGISYLRVQTQAAGTAGAAAGGTIVLVTEP